MSRDGETDVFLNKKIYKNFGKVQVMEENVFEAYSMRDRCYKVIPVEPYVHAT